MTDDATTRRPIDYRAYLVTDRMLMGPRDLEAVVLAAVAGGITVVQLREKNRPDHDIVAIARRLHHQLAPLGIPLLVNDRADLAAAAEVDGVHLGQEDGTVEEARAWLGPNRIIGVSIDRAEEAPAGCDYVGLGPIFPTTTKNDAGPVVGLDGLRRMRPLLRQPIVAIGGITQHNAAAVIAAGADGVAVVGAIMSAANPEVAARNLRIAVDSAHSSR